MAGSEDMVAKKQLLLLGYRLEYILIVVLEKDRPCIPEVIGTAWFLLNNNIKISQ